MIEHVTQDLSTTAWQIPTKRSLTVNDSSDNRVDSVPTTAQRSDRTTGYVLSLKPKLPPILPASSVTSSGQQAASLEDSKRLQSRHTPGLCGLENIGNTCFMNSAIQCLNSIPALTEWVMHQQPPLPEKNVIDIYISLVQSMCSGRNSCVNPRKLKDIVSRTAPIFTDFGQKDAQEFMNSLLNAIQNVDPNLYLVNLFQIHTQSKTICSKKQHVDTTDEIITFLPLPIPDMKSHDHSNDFLLEDLIQDFCQEDELTGQYYCQQCNELLSARQKTSIMELLPPALIIQLKRFPFDSTSRKLDTLVRYKLEHQNLLSKNDKYTLCAVSMHSGNLSGGHYTTLARNYQTQKWYRFNDSHVQEIDSKNVVDPLQAQHAYILVYLKHDC